MSVKNIFTVIWDYNRVVDNLRIQDLRNPIKTLLFENAIFNRQFVHTYVTNQPFGFKSSLQNKVEVKAFENVEAGA